MQGNLQGHDEQGGRKKKRQDREAVFLHFSNCKISPSFLTSILYRDVFLFVCFVLFFLMIVLENLVSQIVNVKVQMDRNGGIPKSLLLECVRVVLLLWRLEIQLHV